MVGQKSCISRHIFLVVETVVIVLHKLTYRHIFGLFEGIPRIINYDHEWKRDNLDPSVFCRDSLKARFDRGNKSIIEINYFLMVLKYQRLWYLSAAMLPSFFWVVTRPLSIYAVCFSCSLSLLLYSSSSCCVFFPFPPFPVTLFRRSGLYIFSSNILFSLVTWRVSK